MNNEELTRESEALNEQVKLLVKTERRLYGAQRVIEMQLRRLHALTTLATSASRAGDPDLILELALKALLDVLDCDQAVALVPTRASETRLAAMLTQPGCEPAERRWSGRTLPIPRLDKPVLLMPRSAASDASMVALLDGVNEYFAGANAPPAIPGVELLVPLYRKSRVLLGLIVLRKLDLTVSFHETRISNADLPFVELVATRVESDVENVLLYRELATFAAGLEAKVAQRTADLAQSNGELALSLQRVRETQARLVEAGKSAAILTLVAGLSHELNNPIGVILGYAQGLLAEAPSPIQRQLSAIERQARRCSRLVQALLGLATTRPLALDSIPPAILLGSVVSDAQREASEHGVRIYVDLLPADLPALLISEEIVREALGQLVKNALDATAHGGTVTLSARERRRNMVDGVELSVQDSGAGIPRAFLSRIFDPFFTTKPPGKGVGLGLSLVRRSVESHRGRIDVRSELGRGTTVRVWLPVIVNRQRAPEPRAELEDSQ
jgi:signal transduction histidine kinase